MPGGEQGDAVLDEELLRHERPRLLVPGRHHLRQQVIRQTKLIAPLARWLGAPDGKGRAARISILWTGFLTNWKLLPIQPLDKAAHLASTRRWLEAATQAIVDEGER